jgi:hypothetical protein
MGHKPKCSGTLAYIVFLHGLVLYEVSNIEGWTSLKYPTSAVGGVNSRGERSGRSVRASFGTGIRRRLRVVTSLALQRAAHRTPKQI